MDKKLKLLKSYLDSRVKSYEKLTGLPLADGVLEMRMLVNSDPGLIRIFVGPGTPDEGRARTIDVWYNGTFFQEKAIVGWNRFDKYNEEFTTTILDAYSDSFPVDVPLKLEIDGPTFIDLDVQRTAEYRVFMTLESGRRFYLDEAEIFAQDRSGKVFVTTDPNTGVGIANFVALQNTTNLTIKARFKLGDFTTLTAELPVQALLEGTTIDEAYTIFIQGPPVVKFGETGNYTATLQTVFLETGETTMQDVTNMVAWSANTDGNISLAGAFTPARPDSISLISTISATLTKVLGNGSTFDVFGRLDITVIRMAVREVLVEGPDRVKENKTGNYTAKVIFMNGDVNSAFDPIVWSIDQLSLGSIGGGVVGSSVYSAPMVFANTPQTIIADIVFEGENHRGEKSIIVEDIADPILTITGPTTIYDTDTAAFTAQLTFEGRTFDVTPSVWELADVTQGSINLNAVLRPNRNAENVNITVTATMTYEGYLVSGAANVLVYASALRPVSLTVSGASSIIEGNSSNYVAIAIMSDGSSRDVTNIANWLVDDTNHTIGSTGNLVAGQVNFDVQVNVTAMYTLNGVQQIATKAVSIKDDPIVWLPQALSITGPSEVNEEESANYVAVLTLISNKGAIKTENTTVDWRVDKSGTIDNAGHFIASAVTVTTSVIISAIYNDGINLPRTESKTVTVKDVALLVSLSLTPQQTTLFGGFNTPFVAKLLRKTGGEVEVTNNPAITYTTSPSGIITVDRANKLCVAKIMTETKTVRISASFSEGTETITAFMELVVRENDAGALILSPGSLDLYSEDDVQLTTTLSLKSGGNSLVDPVYVLDNHAIGTIDANGVFTASNVLDDISGTIKATYNSNETGDIDITSNTITVLVKAIVPTTLEIFTDNGIYTVNEGNSIYLSSKVNFNNGGLLNNDLTVTYSIRPEDAAFATLTHDPVSGVLQVFGKDIIADKAIPVTAAYKYAGDTKTITGTKIITVKYQRVVVDLLLTIESGPYFYTRPYNLVLREKYDDGTTGAKINSGATWNYDSALMTIANNVSTMNADSGDFTITATKNGITSNVVSGSIIANRPVSITAYSSEGEHLRRDQVTTLEASMLLTDGTTTSPNSTWPVVWALEHSDFGSIVVGNDYRAVFTVISALTSGSVMVTATCLGVSTVVTLDIAGFAVPTGVTISGPNTVVSGSSAEYELTVNFSDNSVEIIKLGSVKTAEFEILFDDPKFTEAGTISSNGSFIAPKHLETSGVIGAIHAAYFDENLQEYFEAIPYDVSIEAALPITAINAIINGSDTMNAGTTQDFSLVVTMSEGPNIVINATSAKTAIWSATKGTVINGKYTSEALPSGYDEVLSATYEGITATKNITVNPTVASGITATPSSISIFENMMQTIVVKTNTGVEIKPNWSILNNSAGTMDKNTGIFTAKTVSADINTTMLGTYSGPETNNAERTVTVGILVKDLTAKSLQITAVSGGNSVDEGGSATFKSIIKLSDDSTFDATNNVVYTVVSGGSYVTLSDLNAILTLTGLNVINTSNVKIKAEYTHIDGKKVSDTLDISVIDRVQKVVDVVVDVVAPKTYYEGDVIALRVREKFDNGTFGAPITTAISWTVSNSALATVNANNITLAEVTGNQNITVSATVNGKTSETPFPILITDIVPASITITSSNGLSIKRGTSTVFSAEITLNNGVKTAPNGKYPITWTNNNSGVGSFTSITQTYKYEAAASDVDKLFMVTATAANSVFKTENVTLDGFPIISSATIEGLASIAAGTTTDYTMKVTMSDGAVREISATKTAQSAVWSSTVSFAGAGAGAGISVTNGRVTAGSTALERLGKVVAIYTDSVSGLSVTADKNIKVLAALPVPITASASLTGPQTVNAGEVAEYTLTVPLSDGTTDVITSSSVPTAAWSTDLTGTLSNGKFTAPSLATESNGSITVTYTKNGQSVNRNITVKVLAKIVTTTPPPPGGWEDAVYVGEIPHNYGEFILNNDATTVAKMTSLLQYKNANDGNLEMIRKVGTGTKQFTEQTINMDYWNDTTGAVSNTGLPKNITERMLVMYPKKYGKSLFEAVGGLGWSDYYFMDGIDVVPTIKLIKSEDSSNTALNPMGDPFTISLPIAGVHTDFYIYFASSGTVPTAEQNRSVMQVRTKI